MIVIAFLDASPGNGNKIANPTINIATRIATMIIRIDSDPVTGSL